MAQALFDEHPLEVYLKNAGEAPEFIPGSSAELQLELDPTAYLDLDDNEYEEVEWRPLFLIKIYEILTALKSALDLSSHPDPFVECFKYNVISSSLLAANLPSAHARTSHSLPGQLDHSRRSSLEVQPHTPTPLPTVNSDPSYTIPSLAFFFSVAFFNSGHIFLAIISLGATMHTFKMTNNVTKHDMSPSIESLNDLIASSDEWEAVIQKAINVLEADEQSSTYNSATPPSPSSPIRVALHSSLLTTQTQCDNVRQLFCALTSPSELSQLSEMYAPPSPMNPLFESSQRPLSLPARKRRSSMPPDSHIPAENKRATWNGSYSRLPLASNSSQIFKRREKRRSDMSSLLQVGPLSPKTRSAPSTPMPASPGPSPTLPNVDEEADMDHNGGVDCDTIHDAQVRSFGSAALNLHRSRKSAGMEAFKIPPSSYFSTTVYPVPQTPSSSGSRFTPIQTAKHSHSMTALYNALQGALASKRYACSHLLALRFSDEEDEGYWEDVRSVMSLLTTTLLDASSRLAGALELAERQKLQDQNPTPCLMETFPVSEDDANLSKEDRQERRIEDISFAPMPNLISRFVTHAENIMTALDDAKENLEECVVALKEERTPIYFKRKGRLRSSVHVEGVPKSHALEAYERLRYELGLALRECERGRARLLDIIYPVDQQNPDDSDEDDLPTLAHDASDDSDKPDPAYPFDDVEHDPSAYPAVAVNDAEGLLDDVTSHLLLTASTQHLPPPGIEQVYEADSGNVGIFTREKSKLTREERIRLVKARRESGNAPSLGNAISPATEKEIYSSIEKWGPSGEVVQELKDVIWKVGERRRKMLESRLDGVVPSESLS